MLTQAAAQGNLERVKELLKETNWLKNCHDDQGQTPLRRAAMNSRHGDCSKLTRGTDFMVS